MPPGARLLSHMFVCQIKQENRVMLLSTGVPNPMHIPGGPQFSSMDELGVGSNRAKRYSSQRQRTVPEPAPPMHLGVVEGHYYEPSKMRMNNS